VVTNISLQRSLRTRLNNWTTRSNADLDRLINGADIARFIKAQRIRRLGHTRTHTHSMGSTRTITGITGSRQTGKPRIRCKDIKKPNVNNWKELALNRKAWNELAEKPRSCEANARRRRRRRRRRRKEIVAVVEILTRATDRPQQSAHTCSLQHPAIRSILRSTQKAFLHPDICRNICISAERCETGPEGTQSVATRRRML
jgi:hypothetical protein